MDLLIPMLLAGVLCLVWGAVLLRRGGLLGGALVVLLAGVCFSHPFFNLPLGPLPLTIDRVLLVGLVTATIICRRFGWTRPKPMTPADWALAAFVGVLIASTLTHDWQANKMQPVAQVLFFFLMPVAMYWVVRQMPISDRALEWMYVALGMFGIYLALTSLAEVRQMWAFVFPRYIGSTEYVEFYGRGRGPLLNPAGSGIVQGLCLLGMLMRWPRASRLGQLFIVALFPLYAWGIYSTFTRSAWLGLALGLMVVLAFSLSRVWRTAVIGTLVLATLPLVALNWERLMSFKRDKELSAAEAAESAKLRPILAVIAWHMFLDRPLLGSGYGQYQTESLAYLSDRSIDLPLEKARPYVQHNVFLALAVDTGLVGMGLFVAMLLLWMRMAWRLWCTHEAPPAARQFGLMFLAFVGVWFPNAMFQDVLMIPMANMLLVFLAGLVVNLEAMARATANDRRSVAGDEPNIATPAVCLEHALQA
ncbi:MAG TPA: O-antigen ligase family protein [Pirellulales bacterium]|jgi:O-antigen ligase|nr:O-antigen ligase family protein [Pirellulales bacterium]